MDANLLGFVELSQATQSQIEELLKVRNSSFVSSAMLIVLKSTYWNISTGQRVPSSMRHERTSCYVLSQVK